MIFSTSIFEGFITVGISQIINQYILINYLTVFQAIFGLQAKQSLSTLIIQKNELIGLTVQANNTAESLLVSVLIRAINTETKNKISIYKWNTSFANSKIVNTIIFELLNVLTPVDIYELPELTNTINPMNY